MKKIFVVLVITMLLSASIYFLLFHKNKNLKFIPENADAIVLVDVKKATRQYISELLTHPSEWLKDDKKNKSKISFSKSGVKIPDFLQVFHLKNTKISEWYTILEIENKEKFSAFLESRQFVNDGKDRFKNGRFFIQIKSKNCIVGTSDQNLKNIVSPLSQKFRNKVLNADSFMQDSFGSISFISELRTRNFSIDLNEDEIEIKSNESSGDFKSLIADLESKTEFLKAELDQNNIKNISSVFNKNISDSLSVNSLKMSVNLEEINDTIISYGYDDNFNEIEKVSYQKIVQPNYELILQTSNADKTWTYFQQKKWINSQSQFTAIPFQPNSIYRNKNQISIKSTRKSVKNDDIRKQNYIFVKNNPLLFSVFKTFGNSYKEFFKNVDYIFYGNKSQDYLIKIKLKKNELPLILRL